MALQLTVCCIEVPSRCLHAPVEAITDNPRSHTTKYVFTNHIIKQSMKIIIMHSYHMTHLKIFYIKHYFVRNVFESYVGNIV